MIWHAFTGARSIPKLRDTIPPALFMLTREGKGKCYADGERRPDAERGTVLTFTEETPVPRFLNKFS